MTLTLNGVHQQISNVIQSEARRRLAEQNRLIREMTTEFLEVLAKMGPNRHEWTPIEQAVYSRNRAFFDLEDTAAMAVRAEMARQFEAK